MVDYYAELELSRRDCTSKQASFALALISGLGKEGALYQVYGQKYQAIKYKHRNNEKINKLLAGPSGRYFGLLSHPINEQIISPYAIERTQRLNLLSMGAVLAYQSAKTDPDVKALNPMVRCINELNKMTGEHAAERVEIHGAIMAASINAELSEVEATELYKQVIQGARIEVDNNTHIPGKLEEYQPLTKNIDRKSLINDGGGAKTSDR